MVQHHVVLTADVLTRGPILLEVPLVNDVPNSVDGRDKVPSIGRIVNLDRKRPWLLRNGYTIEPFAGWIIERVKWAKYLAICFTVRAAFCRWGITGVNGLIGGAFSHLATLTGAFLEPVWESWSKLGVVNRWHAANLT
jgi:hypothetical protein